jgi:hypothetical protein
VLTWHNWAYTSPSVAHRTTKILPRTTETDSIVERKCKDGTVSYRAQILIKSKGRIVHQESSSFDRLTTAKAWLKRREKELTAPDGLDAARRKSGSVGNVIDDYLKSTGGVSGKASCETQLSRQNWHRATGTLTSPNQLRLRSHLPWIPLLSTGPTPTACHNAG